MTANHRRDLLDDIQALAQRVKALEGRMALPAAAGVCTSTTRPANPRTGQQIFETDTGATAVWNGSAWAYQPAQIGTTVLTGNQPSIALPVPVGFTQIHGVFTGRQDSGSGGAYCFLRLNADAGATYVHQNLTGNISTAAAANAGSLVNGIRAGVLPGAGDAAGYFGTGSFVIGNASGATTYKAVSSNFQGPLSTTNAWSGTYGGLWQSTAPITSVTLLPATGNLVAGSSLTLYGLK